MPVLGQYQRKTEKGTANGYAGLDSSGLVPPGQIPPGGGGAAWGGITGTLASQTDLQAALDGKAPTTHNHDAAYEAVGSVAAHVAASDPHVGYQKESERGVANGYASLGSGGLAPMSQLATGTPTGAKFLRDDGTLAVPPGGGGSSISSASVPFTDGDTVRRVTISDASVSPASKILVSVRRPNVADSADKGYIYITNVVTIAAGSFDVLISCLGYGLEDPTKNPPNETISLLYQIG